MQIIENRKIFFIISAVLIIASIVALFAQGLNFGIDFKGGSIISVKIDTSLTAPDVKNVLVEKLNMDNAEVQKSGKEFYIRTTELNQEQTSKLISALKDEFGEVEFLSAESVGATIGKELTRNAFISLLLATLIMLVFIAYRFEWSFGFAAVAAILHSVIVVLGLYAAFQWEVSSAFIAAMLTVIGYSINDTIIIFDRVRENLRMKKKEPFEQLLNKSIMQTLNRSVNTVLNSSFPLIALLLFGGITIKFFVLAMLLGFVVGAYTSIFIASPLLYEIKNKAA